MNFSEAFARYKSHAASPEETAFVEAELEKNELINDYLSERLEAQLPESLGETSPPDASGIRRAVRFRLARVVLFTVAIVALLALLVWKAALPAYDRSFYNPNDRYSDRNGPMQFFVDVSAFTELHFPGYITEGATAEPLGLGNYAISIRQRDSFGGPSDRFNDRIVRGSAQNVLNGFYRFAIGNAFYERGGSITEVTEPDGTSHYDQNEETRLYYIGELKKLPETSYVSAYFSFREDLTMEEFAEVQKANPLHFPWVAVRISDRHTFEQIGFEPSGNGLVLEEGMIPEEDYPCFELANTPRQEGGGYSPEALEQHFKSLVNYMGAREDFLTAMARVNGIDASLYRDASAYLEENGVKTYGVLVQGSVRDILDFAAQPYINSIMVNDVKLSMLSR